KLKDRVDSASGAFGKLVNVRRIGPMRFLRTRKPDPSCSFRIVVGSQDQVAHTELDQRHLLVSITDPSPESQQHPPILKSDQLLDSLVVAFADLDPADHQETWDEPISPYAQPADQLIMTPELGKKIWSFLLRKRDPSPEAFVLLDSGDRRA